MMNIRLQSYHFIILAADLNPPEPVSEHVLREARVRREQEQVARRVFFELVLYVVFVLCVLGISYGNRDIRTFRTNDHLETMLYSANGEAPFPFESVFIFFS